MRRVVFGGTFDPPHVAHLVVAETAYRSVEADAVTFIPAGEPWQKAERDVTPGPVRLEMVELAVSGVDYFEADGRELLRDGWTYTIDTLNSFDPSDELVLVMGADAAAGLRTWRRWEEILERAAIAVVPRPGTTRSEVQHAAPGSAWLDMPAIDVSSTEIRDRAASGKSVRFLVPDPAWRLIEQRRLYR